MFSKVKYEYLLLIIAVLWVVFFSYVLQLTPHFSEFGDDNSYMQAAQKLYFESKVDDTRPLLITALNGLPFLFGFSKEMVIKWGLIVNFIAWFLTIIIIFKIVASQFNRKTGFHFGILFLFCIGNLAHAFNFLAESIYILMLVSSVYFISCFYNFGKHHYLTIALSILLINSLIKPVSIGIAALLILFYFSKIKLITLNKYSVFVAISLSLIGFHMYSVKKNYGDFTISYIGSITYYNYLGAKADCYKKNIEFVPDKIERATKFGKLSCHEMNQIASVDLKQQIKTNPVNLIKAYFYCLYSNSSKGNYIVSECKNDKQTGYFNFFHLIFKAFTKVQNILFTIIGVVVSFFCLIRYKKEAKFYQFISVMILYIFLISGISCLQCDRFHIAFFPLVIVLLNRFINKKSPTLSY